MSCLFARVDVVIPVHKKDAPTLDIIIDALEKNVENLGIIYTISNKRYSDRAEWIDEKDFPFSLEDVGKELGVGDHPRCGWYFQQLLKFYAHKQIEGLTEAILIIDADTKPTHKMKFIDDQGKIYLDTIPCRCMLRSYYVHMDKLLLGIKNIDYNVNPVNHHAVFTKQIIEDMFFKVESTFNLPFWKVFLNKVDSKNPARKVHFYAGASEYMIYYHFCKNYHKDKVIDRTIKLFEGAKDLNNSPLEMDFDFISCHKYKL